MILRCAKTQQRARVLRSGGDDSGLIQYLIRDAQLLDDIKTNQKEQMEILRSFQSQYLSNPWKTAHEQPLEEVKRRVNEIQSEVEKLGQAVQDELGALFDMSQNIIQLVMLPYIP